MSCDLVLTSCTPGLTPHLELEGSRACSVQQCVCFAICSILRPRRSVPFERPSFDIRRVRLAVCLALLLSELPSEQSTMQIVFLTLDRLVQWFMPAVNGAIWRHRDGLTVMWSPSASSQGAASSAVLNARLRRLSRHILRKTRSQSSRLHGGLLHVC